MWGIIKRTLAILTPRERRKLVPLLIMMVVGALLESLGVTLVVPLIAGIMDPAQLTDGFMGMVLQTLFGQQEGRTYLIILFVAMIAVFLVKNAFLIWQTYVQNKVTALIRVRVQNRLLHYYLSRPYAYFLDSDSGDIMRTITTDSDYYYSLLNHVLKFFAGIAVMGIITVAVFAIDPQMTLLLIVVLLAEYLIILHVIRPLMRKQGLLYREALGHGNGMIIEMLRGIKSVKVGGKEQFFEKRYATDVDKLVHARMIEQTFAGVPSRLIEAITVSALLAYLLILLMLGRDMSSLVPILSAFILAASRILPCIGSVSNSVSYAHYYEGSLSRVEEIDQQLSAEGENAHGVTEHSEPFSFADEIRLEGIRFAYPESDKPVLDGVDMVIPHNKSVGIVGASGAGKTTLVDVLLGLLEAQDGTVSLDGKVIDPTCSAWQRLFAYIPQNVFMLSGTILENVVFGQAEPRDEGDAMERVWTALEAAQLADFIRSLDKGIYTEIGEAGVRLSGGQIQRLGIARALFSDAPILVFDEATSALDYDTEEALMDAVTSLRGKKTLVIIAHRLATIENCDTVYRVEDGIVGVE